jgi:hypothetical protein
MKSFQLIELLLLSAMGILSLSGYGYGHTFTSNENASFLSLMDDLKSIISSLEANEDNPTLVTDYANDASLLLDSSIMKEINETNQRLGTSLSSLINDLRNESKEIRDVGTVLINDIIDDIISARIDKSDLENVTIQSLAVSLDLNKIFEYYSRAYDISGSKMNMSGHSMMNERHSDIASPTSNSITSLSNNSNTIKDIRSYYHGLSLAEVTTERFNDELKDNLNSTDIEYLDIAFDDLLNKLSEKRTTNEISGIIHGQIQPELQRIFQLVLD